MDDVPDPSLPDQNVIYTLTYTNPGATDLTGVQVTAAYDSGLSFVSAFPPPDPSTNRTWTIGSLPAGTAGRVFVTLAPNTPNLEGWQAGVQMVVTANGGTILAPQFVGAAAQNATDR